MDTVVMFLGTGALIAAGFLVSWGAGRARGRLDVIELLETPDEIKLPISIRARFGLPR